MSKIFEEALADAKKLKEIAEENAQKAILESVTPQIKKFIEQQLLEQDDLIEEEEETIVLDESAIKSLVKMIGADTIYNNVKQKDKINEAVGTALNNLDDKDRLRMIHLINKINENKNILSNKDIINDQTNSDKESTKMRKSEKHYEVDLNLLRESVSDRMFELADQDQEQQEENVKFGEDALEEDFLYEEDSVEEPTHELAVDDDDDEDEASLIAELSALLEQDEEEAAEEPELEELPEEDLADEPAAPAGGDMVAKDELEAQIEELIADLGLDIGGGAVAAAAPAEEPELEGEFEDLDMEEEPAVVAETFNIDPRMLRQELNNIRKMLSEGNVDHQFGGKAGGKAGVDGAFGGKGKKNAGVKSAFGGGKEGQDPFVNPPQINKLNEAIRKLRRLNRSQSEKLNKYRGAVKTLREQLEDLNLFNAKLLYVNKLLQNKNLNESQKKSVIKALDEAKSLGETKALYKSLTESLSSSSSKTLNESKRFGSSSKTTTSGSGAKNRTVGESNRWARLAGLK